MNEQSLRAARRHVVRAAIAGAIAIAALVVASSIGDTEERASDSEKAWAYIGAAVVLVAGIVAVRAAARALRVAGEARIEATQGTLLALLVSIIGYVAVLLTALQATGSDIGGLLLGGALTGVVVGIAAQQTLANFFAGIVLAFVRPFHVGEHVVLRSGPLGGEYEGVVSDMGLFYVGLATENGPVALPNAGVLTAAIGPGARTRQEQEQQE